MKAHNEATMSFGKMLLIVGALVAGAGLSGAFGDGKTPPPDLSKVGNLFDVAAAENEPPKRAKKEKRVVGVVSSHTSSGLVIVPASDDPITEVTASAAQQERCQPDDRYPACLN
ncbi:hypothetical protein [Nonomuraea sp. GTA35]|uniref:hypothetical protein n=1 Tax=Nonomuraea sp. GTA35 TaxID=1676746 RepID=UPI0035C20DB7